MASTRIKVGGAAGALVLAAALAIGPVVNYFEPAPPTPAGLSVAYKDMNSRAQPWTICDGHTGPEVHEGDTATPAQCKQFSLQDRLVASQTVHNCLPWVRNPDQMAALADAAYNLGPAVVCGSTLQAKAKAGDYWGMCTQLTDAKTAAGMPDGWTHGNGKRLKGLVLRRIYDRDWCLGHKHEGFP